MATTDTNLYRALNKTDWPEDKPLVKDGLPAAHLLDPQFDPKSVTSGDVATVRAPDVIYDRQGNVLPGGGTSLFDREYVFGAKWWRSFTIPEGTEVPDSLAIVKGEYSARRMATHYQIEVRAGRMTRAALIGALDNLARNAIVKSVAAAKQTT